jgi:hypothetical protein
VYRISEWNKTKGVLKYASTIEQWWRECGNALEFGLELSQIRTFWVGILLEEIIFTKAKHWHQ